MTRFGREVRGLVFVDPITAGVAVGDVFVHRPPNYAGDGPMKTRADFWEVVAVTPKRVRAARMCERTVEEVADPDGVFYGGRRIVPVPGKLLGPARLVRVSVGFICDGEVLLHLPRRVLRGATAERWDGKPEFVHPN